MAERPIVSLDQVRGLPRQPEVNLALSPRPATSVSAPVPAPAPATAPPPPPPDGVDVTYLPNEGDPHTTKWRGVEFKANLPVRLMDKDHIEAARTNRFFRVGLDEPPGSTRGYSGPPKTAMEYRGRVVAWIKTVETVDQVAAHWAADRALRAACEVGQDDISYLGTLVEPKLKALRLKEGLNDVAMAGIWVKHGNTDIPWRS